MPARAASKSTPRRPKRAARRADVATRRGGAPVSIVILAAGQGLRMRSALPKVLQPLAGKPLLAHVIELAAALVPAALYVVYGHAGERVREQFASFTLPGSTHASPPGLQWVRQSEQLGTGHALAQALPGIPDAHQVLVLYGDVPLLRLQTLRALCELAGAGATALLSASLDDATGYGRLVRDRRGALRRIVEQADASVAERAIREVNTGVLIAPAAQLKLWLGRLKRRNAQGEFYLTDVVAMAIAQGQRVKTLRANDAAEVIGVNDKAQLADAETHYRRRRAAELMAQGVTVVDPARIDVRGAIEAEPDVLLDVNVVLEGPVRLGAGVRIGPSCVISNTSIGARTVLQPHCVVQDADIGADCCIGPFARLRPGTQLARGAHVGNFVEIKNSQIGPDSKVNHLSYVGDASVGRDVNVGAGTITCNYDGVHKWRTQVGDGAFIGSGCMLVAPVSIGAGATIGAGSTITADAPADKLTLARTRQQTVEGWQRRRKG